MSERYALQQPRSSIDEPSISTTTVLEVGGALTLAAALIVALIRRHTNDTLSSHTENRLNELHKKWDEEEMLRKQITDILAKLAEQGFERWGLEDDLTKWGCVTDLPEVLELFKVLHTQTLRPVANIHIDKNLSFDASIESIYTQISGQPVPEGAGRQKIMGFLDQKDFALAITIDPMLDQEIVQGPSITQKHNNSDIGMFQNIVRSWEQRRRGVPVCAYSENPRAVPTEVGINLLYFGRPRKRRDQHHE